MIDMKKTKAEKKAEKENYALAGPTGGADGYPYGLQLHLDDCDLEKLGIETMPRLGKTYTIVATAEVTEARSSQRSGGADERSLTLQVQKMELSGGSVTDALDEAMSDEDGGDEDD